MPNKIIGRTEEQLELKDILNAENSEFIAVYGRRRVGKTYLIRSYFQTNNKCVFFQVIGLQDNSLKAQLENFTEEFSKAFYDNLPMQTFSSWKEAFQRLTAAIDKLPANKKIIIFLDELPWMTTPRSGLLEALGHIWNKAWVDNKNLKLFICGSSASWILKKVINDKGGLHNRVTRQIILRPFLLHETKAYLAAHGCSFNEQQILELYMAIGGIPFYLNGVKKSLSAAQNINNLCFRSGGLLFDEFNKLFRSLFKEADYYIELLKYIATKRYGIARSELENQAKLSTKGGTLTERLKNLEDAGFILSFLPMPHKERGTYYKVIDEFSLFYLNWVEPEKDTLIKLERKSNFWKLNYNTPAWNSWSGYAFEAVCYKHVELIRSTLEIPDGSRASVWKHTPPKASTEQGAQIDLLFDRKDGVINLCEIKYTDKPFVITKEYAQNLLSKKEVFKKATKTQKQLFISMITANGLKDNFYAQDIVSKIVTLADMLLEPIRNVR